MKNALICFLKFPEPGHVKTRLAKDLGTFGATELYKALVERLITEVYPLEKNYDLILCFDPTHPLQPFHKWIGNTWNFWEQEGDDLGERLNLAVARAFEEEYQHVIVIGSDCIGMDEAFMQGIFKSLNDYDFAIGPSSDGGYYLLGLNACQPWVFENIAWSTETVFETTVDKFEARDLKFLQLEEMIDIDTLDDLIQFREALPEEHFLAKKIDRIVLNRLSPPEEAHDIIF